MATHSRILAWEIPWAEETARLNSMMSQRVGHNLAFKQQLSIISLLNWICVVTKNQLTLLYAFISGFFILFYWSFSVSLLILHSLGYCRFIVSIKLSVFSKFAILFNIHTVWLECFLLQEKDRDNMKWIMSKLQRAWKCFTDSKIYKIEHCSSK